MADKDDSDEVAEEKLEEKIRSKVVAICRKYEHKSLVGAGVDMGMSSLYCSFLTMRSTKRQDGLMKQMHEESRRMRRLTFAVMVMTAAVVLLSIMQLVRGWGAS